MDRRRISISQVVAFLVLDATLSFLFGLRSGARLSLLDFILTQLALSLAYLLIAILVTWLLKLMTCDRQTTLLSDLIPWRRPRRPEHRSSGPSVRISRCKSVGPENPVMSCYIQSSENEASCAVCLKIFGEVDVCRVWGRCGHVFHEQCVEAWLSRKAVCPTCRGHVRIV
uniref:RING-type E3 ubiquitin transferase n=1 Tax=Kalanchoe fedtschenkoi TaxID=63787 RepID=A0A7N1A4D9_KALFE